MIPEIFLELIQHKMANLQIIFQNTVPLRYRSYGDGTATVPNPGPRSVRDTHELKHIPKGSSQFTERLYEGTFRDFGYFQS
jgi:hypothetical protein